jgi:hypothetical protein
VPQASNRSPALPNFSLPEVWRSTGPIVLRWTSRDPDGDPVRHRILYRSVLANSVDSGKWKTIENVVGSSRSMGAIKPAEQRCFRIVAVDSHGASSMTAVRCTNGMYDDRQLVSSFPGFRAMTGVASAWKGTLSVATKSSPKGLYMGAYGSRVELTFAACRTCGSVRLHRNGKVYRTVSLRGNRTKIVTIPLRGEKKLTSFGFSAVDHTRPVRFDSLAVVRGT